MDKGAHYFRCDLQVHTPRDLRWAGKDCVSADDRRAYAESLVSACRGRKLQAIAITDHHDMAFVSYVRKAAEEETDDGGVALPPEQRLIVLPGMELTLGIPCQTLLVLDADFPTNMLQPLMTAFRIQASPDNEAKTAEVARLDHIHSFKELKEELDGHSWLKDRYIIFPNVTNEGEFSLLRKGLAGKCAEMPCVGGYIDGSIATLKPGICNILAGKEKEWGNKRLAYFQTSDSRREDHRDLGSYSTWIKWAVPTAEALRQACLAQESRVSYEEPRLPPAVITGITVSNSAFLGPIELELNPQYSVLIGGRGTGKSTILEYLRWALCDQPPDVTAEDAPNYQSRRLRLIEQTLKIVNATVDVRFVVNEVPHVVRRHGRDGSILIKVASDDFRECTEDEVRTLLPIQAYSQKQLSDVSVRTNELTRFVMSPVRSRLRQIQSHIDDSASRVRQSYATRLRQRTLSAEIGRRKLEQRSLQGQADALRGALTDLSEEDRTLLDQGKIYEAADATMESWLDDLKSLRDGAAQLRQSVAVSLAGVPEPPGDPEAEILTRAFEEFTAIMNESDNLLGKVVAKADSPTLSLEDTTSRSHPCRLPPQPGDSCGGSHRLAQESIQEVTLLPTRVTAYARIADKTAFWETVAESLPSGTFYERPICSLCCSLDAHGHDV